MTIIKTFFKTLHLKINNKQAAMFGLDARIALAIFGALSVITGAALFSTIKQSKVTKNIADMTELGKAEEQYFLDTNKLLPRRTLAMENKSIFKNVNLIENIAGVSGWKGPYIGYERFYSDSDISLKSSLGMMLDIRVASMSSAWGADSDIPNFTDTCPNAPCGIWIELTVDNYEIADAIDKKIDGTNDRTHGKVRVRNIGVAGCPIPTVYLLSRPFYE